MDALPSPTGIGEEPNRDVTAAHSSTRCHRPGGASRYSTTDRTLASQFPSQAPLWFLFAVVLNVRDGIAVRIADEGRDAASVFVSGVGWYVTMGNQRWLNN